MKRGLFVLVLTAIALASAQVKADQVIEFPKQDLARETVLPIFDRPDAVLNRHIVTKNRLEIGPFMGWVMTDPFFNSMAFGANLSYHFDETNGINLLGLIRTGGLNSSADSIDSDPKTNLNLNYMPQPQSLFLASYQYSAFYGKLSITKETVVNFHTFGLLGVGSYDIGGSAFPAVDIGLGQKYYLTTSFALRFELRLLAYQGPDILGRTDLHTVTTPQPASSFGKKIFFDSIATVGVVYLLPAL